MKHRGRYARATALVVAGAFVVASCGGSDDSADGGSTEDGTEVAQVTDNDTCGTTTMVWAHEQEPPDLHVDDPSNGLTITAWIRAGLLEGFYGVSAATEFVPELLASEGEMTENADGTVTVAYTMRDGLTWSDGTPLTTESVKQTYDMIMAKGADDEYVYLLGDRTGLDTITDITVTSPTQMSVTWSTFFAGWKTAFSEVYPMHVFSADPATAAAEVNDALRTWTHNGATLPSSGPLLFGEWNKGVSMTLNCNPTYHGSSSPDAVNRGVAQIGAVQVNFVADTDAQINALKSGEADLIMTQPQLAFEELSSNSEIAVASSAGPTYEHWGINLFNKHLKKPEVREALALAMNKADVMAGLYTPLFGDVLPASGLGNAYWMSNQSTYVDNAGNAGYGKGDVEAAKARLESAGYVLGADGIYEHPTDGKLSLRVGTTGGNKLRELQQQLLQAKFKEAGIEIIIDNPQGSAYWDEQPFNEEALKCANSGGTEGNCEKWDIAQFAWVGGPWPGGMSSSFRTGAGLNIYGFASAEFDAKADECDATVDDAVRADCYNELDTYVTTLAKDPQNGLFVIPITQKPSFYAVSKTRLATFGVAPDANSAGPLANVADFRKN